MIIAKYKYDSSVYADFVPVFNDGYSGYTISDVVDGNMTTRTIECDILPTLIRFGNEGTTNSRTDSLLEVLDINTSGLTSCISMFRSCNNLTSIMCNWDTSNVTNMSYMFNGCTNLTSLDVSGFNTGNVTTMYYMFYNCKSLTSLDVSGFNTGNVTTMESMFWNCKNLTSLDVSNWDTSKLSYTMNMFEDCQNLTSLDVSNWDTSKLSYTMNMFIRCQNLTSLDVSNWDTSKLINIQFMFESCKSLTSLDVSNWDTSNVASMMALFQHCTNLTSLDISNWDTGKVTNMSNMFTNTASLTDIGMVYCNPSTVSKLSSALNTQVRNVYVECDPLCYDKYQYITYIQYKEDKKALLYLDDETNTWKKPVLREWDSIEKHSDGKYYYHIRSGEVVLDGSENWFENSNISNNTHAYFTEYLENKKPNTDMWSDKYPYYHSTLITPNDIPMISGQLHSNVIYIKDIHYPITEFKQWLQSNPTTVVYQLAEEKIYECISLDIMSHFNTTNLEINSGVIIPKTTLRLQESVPNVVRELQEKISMLENELVLLKTDEMLSDIQDIINE